MDVMAIQSKSERQKMLLRYTSITLIVIILEIIFRDYLFLTLSRDIITSLQSTFSDKAFPYFFRFISFFGTPSLLVPLFLIIFAAEIKKYLAIKLTLYICFVGYVVSILKSIYSCPRPYWVFPSDPSLPNYSAPGIIPYESYAEFGHPSGHSFLVTSFYGYLYYVFLYKIAKKTPGIGAEEEALSSQPHHRSLFTGFPRDETELQETQKINPEGHHSHHALEIKLPEQHTQQEVRQSPLYPLAKALYFTLMFLIVVSRMYLGMHALNQVLLGLTLGAYSLFLIIYYIDPLLDDFLKKVKARAIRNRGTVFTMFGIAYVILTTIPILLFYKNEENPGILWTDYWVVVSKEVNAPKFTFGYIKCFLDCGVVGVGFGAFAAMMTLENNYLDKGLKFSALTKTALALRIVVFVLTAAVAGVVFLLIPTPPDNWVLKYLINANFATFAATYAAINFAPLVYGKVGLEADKYFHHPRHIHIDYSFSL